MAYSLKLCKIYPMNSYINALQKSFAQVCMYAFYTSFLNKILIFWMVINFLNMVLPHIKQIYIINMNPNYFKK